MYIRITIFLLLCLCSNAYGAYTGTMPKDIGTSTPAGTENPGIIDDVVRERGTIQYNLYKIKFVGSDTTLLANDTWVIGSSSSSSMLISFPAPSSCASTAVSKPFVITNVGTTTMVLNIVVNGVGSRTVSGSETVCLFTDGIRWYEQVNFPNLGTQTIGKLNLGTQTAGTISLGTQTVGTIALGTQTSGTLSLGTQTSGTLALGTQTSGLLSFGTQTSGLLSFGTQTYGTIALGTQTSGTLGLGTQTSGLLSLGTQTLGLLSLGTQTNGQIDFTLQTGKVSLGTQTNNTISLGSQTSGLLSLGTQTNNTISLGSQTSGLLSLGTQTNGTLSLGTQTSGKISLTTQTTGNYLSGWTTGSQTTTATGTVRFNSSGDVTVTSTYDSNGNGTITTAVAAGISAKPDAKVDGVVQVTNPTAYAFPGTRVSITATNTTEALITFKNISFGTETVGSVGLGTQTSGTIALGTQTSGTIALGTQTSGTIGIGSQTSGTFPFSRFSGVPTDYEYFATDSGTATVPIRDASGNLHLFGIDLSGTTTLYAGGTRTTPLLYSRKTTIASDMNSNVLLYMPADAGGSSTTFTDYSPFAATLTRTADAVSSSAWSEFGGASYWGSTGYLAVATGTARYNIFGTDTCYVSAFIKMDTLSPNMMIFSIGGLTTYFYYSGDGAGGANGLSLNIAGGVSILQGTTTGWSVSTRYHVALRKFTGGGYQLLRDGLVVASGTNSTAWSMAGNVIIGEADAPFAPWKGYIDDFYWEKNTNGTNVIPTAAKLVSSYIETTTHYIPVGTTTTFLSIVDSGTYSANTKLVLGAAPYSTTTTGYGLDAAAKNILAKSYVTTPSSSEVKTDLPSKTSPQEEAVEIMRRSKAHKYLYKNKVVNVKIAENKAKDDYLNKQRTSEFELFRALHENEYLEGVTGSMSVNYKRMKDAFEADYPAKMNIKWNALNDKNNRIVEARAHLEKDPDDARNNSDNYGIEIDRDCPKEVLNKDGLPVLEKWAGFNYSVNKGLVDLADRQQQEIGSLTAALENMRVINNLK